MYEPIQQAEIVDEDIKVPIKPRASDEERFYMVRHLADELSIVECQAIIIEIDDALQGKAYEECLSFDYADPDLVLNYPNVEIYGEIYSMKEFRLSLLEWIDYRTNNKEDI